MIVLEPITAKTISNLRSIAQLAEAVDSKSAECGFKSLSSDLIVIKNKMTLDSPTVETTDLKSVQCGFDSLSSDFNERDSYKLIVLLLVNRI